MQIEIDADAAIEIWADRGLLQRAIHNLLANSLRHAPPKGKIQLLAGKGAQHVWLAVRDGGPGLPVALQARLGERFCAMIPRAPAILAAVASVWPSC